LLGFGQAASSLASSGIEFIRLPQRGISLDVG
jgi:hypothetical protein